MTKPLIDPEEIYHQPQEEKWWTRGVYLLAIVFFGMFVASAIKTFVF